MKKVILVLFVLIGIFGFAIFSYGDTVLIIQAPAAGGEWSEIWNADDISSVSDWDETQVDRSFRIYIFGSDLTGSGTTIKVRVEPTATNTTIDLMYIGQQGGDSDFYDYQNGVEITFASGHGITCNNGNDECWSDEISFTINQGTDYIIAWHNSNPSYFPYRTTGETNYWGYKASVTESATGDVTDYIENAYTGGIAEIQAK